MKPKLFIVTGNKMKFEQLALGLKDFFDCEQKVFDEPEIQGKPEEILRHKLNSAYKAFGGAVLVDDVSFHFEELGGFPGPYMKDFFEYLTPYEMGIKFAGSRVSAVCRLGLYLGEEDIKIAEGILNGIVVAPKDNDHKGKWFDLFVQIDGTDKSMIEFTSEEKNKISHRGLAMKNLLAILQKE